MRILIPIFLVLPIMGYCQISEREKIQQQEMEKATRKQQEAARQLDSAVLLMENQEYAAADEKFKYVLKNIKGVPSDLAYYFGENSFHLKKYKQSIDWLNKYIQLKGTNGRFSQQAVDLLKMAEEEHLKESQVQVQRTTEVLSRDYEIDCGPTGKVTCPVCGGSTVIIRKTYLGENYKTCPYCNKQGFLNCVDYNKLVRGELKPVSN